MKILSLHCDWIRFKPVKKALAAARHLSDRERKEKEVKECLVVLIAVEKPDAEGNLAAVDLLVKNIKDIVKYVKTNKIVLYPYAHLSPNLAPADAAMRILDEAAARLSKEFVVVKAPFGWYKQFSLQCKGHPLAELSRDIRVEAEEVEEKEKAAKEKISAALKAEKKLPSEWFILDAKGLHKLTLKADKLRGFNFSKYPRLEKFARYEMKKVRVSKEEPPHVRYMRKLQLVNYEPASDPGNFRFYPKGRMIKALLEEFVTQKTQDYGALEVETPIMYNVAHPALKRYLDRFPARQYLVKTPDIQAFLRFAACFGQFLMAHDAAISYKDLPLKLYELSRYSFRAEQRGELTGLRRLRAFTMPDCHALCADIKQAAQELPVRFELAKSTLGEMGLGSEDLELAIRFTKDFWKENRAIVLRLAKGWKKPALIEIWPKPIFYFRLKYELNFVDSLDKAAALATDQIDVESAQSFGISYIDKRSKAKTPIIMHLSPSGAIERVIYSLLEKAAMAEKAGAVPDLPLWLSPTQVRVVPVSEKYVKQAISLAGRLNKAMIRTDVDDRALHVQKKILEAEVEWVPYIVCLGAKEIKSKRLATRIRAERSKVRHFTEAALIKAITKELADMPFKPLPLPALLSKQPRFV